MARMQTFMAVHHDPGVDCSKVQANWRKMAAVEAGHWLRTYFNDSDGWRYCIWQAPDAGTLQKIFDDMGVSCERIVPVEETVPDMWGPRWEEHIQQDAAADNLGN